MSINPMVITDPEENREYTLEFSRKTVSKAEKAGLVIDKMEDSPMSMIPILFWGAFLMHHPYMTREQTDKILFDGLGGLTTEELHYLGKLYAEPFNALVSPESAENPRKMAVKM